MLLYYYILNILQSQLFVNTNKYRTSLCCILERTVKSRKLFNTTYQTTLKNSLIHKPLKAPEHYYPTSFSNT